MNKYDISKTRYTHRDYDSVKADLIAAIPSLTQEWTSTEDADPGIVLIKLMSMFGDTLSYNVDMIALELYIQSVTQRKNCAKILGLLGYKMHWYRAAKVLANIRLSARTDIEGNRDHALLNPYQTVFLAGTIPYTVTDQGIGSGQIDIYSDTQSVPVKLIQGIPHTVELTGQDLINNRYYFGEGNIDESEFKLVVVNKRGIQCKFIQNLYLDTSGNYINFSFDVDEYDRPYIQFADGWEDITGDTDGSTTFQLTYILTDGAQGNISSNAFTDVRGFASQSSFKDIIVTNLTNTTPYSLNTTSIATYNSPGYNPQTVAQAKVDSSNYVFTHDTLVTSSDYEKAAKRSIDITMSKMVDAQVVINDNLNLDDIISRALDKFTKVTVEEKSSTTGVTEIKEYLSPYSVILYLAYRNFDLSNNYYYIMPKQTLTEIVDGKEICWSIDPTYATRPSTDPYYPLPFPADTDPYGFTNDVLSDAGFYPYKPSENILLNVRESLSKLHILNIKIDFGTIKLFPFKVKGVIHLIEPLSPAECLQVVDRIDQSLSLSYYPSLHDIGNKPNFIELVDIVQNSDVHIKYFDALDNIVEWAPAINTTDPTKDNYINKIFDTTSAVRYNGLSDLFTFGSQFLRYRLKNQGVAPDPEDITPIEGTEGQGQLPENYGTAYLINYSDIIGREEVLTIPINQIETLQLNNIKELKALVTDMRYKGLYVDKDGNSFIINNTGLQWMES